MKLYDLAGQDERFRFSPFCWRVKMALAHKKISYETVPWRFTEKDQLPQPNVGLVPVLDDGGIVVTDSWKIALYLDEKYPQDPLFEGEQAKSQTLLVKSWFESTIHPLLGALLIPEIVSLLTEEDRKYFKESREKRFGKPIETLSDPEKQKGFFARLKQGFDPLRSVLSEQSFICGSTAGFSDYIVFGSLQWARVSSKLKLFEKDDPIKIFENRMLDLHDGFARSARLFDD